MNKLRIGMVAVAAAATLVVIGAYFQTRMREKDKALAEQTDRLTQLEAENKRLSNLVIDAKTNAPQPREPSREMLRLRGEVGVLRRRTNELVGLSQENLRLSQAVAEAQTNQLAAEDQVTVRKTHADTAMTTLLRAIKNYAAAHNGQFPADLEQLIASGDLGATNLAGNLRLDDFEFSQPVGADPGGHSSILRLRVPIATPGGDVINMVGGLDDAGVPTISARTVGR